MFGVANIVAPNVNGYFLSTSWPGMMFSVLGVMLVLFVGAGFLYRKSTATVLRDE